MIKHIILLFWLFLCSHFAGLGQTTVTFVVDATDFVNGGGVLVNDQVSIAGTFATRGSTLPDWQPAPGGMQRIGSSRLYQRTLTFTGPNVTADSLYWKYVSGTGWSDGDEGNEWPIPPPRTCTKTNDNNRKMLIPGSGVFLVSSKWAECAVLDQFVVPGANTGLATAITQTTATVAGNSSGQLVVSRGIVYSTQPNPTLANDSISAGSGTGDFTGNLVGLMPNTLYYARSFARNAMGVTYGQVISFSTLPASTQTVSITFRVDITNYLAGGATLAANGMRIAGNFTTRGANIPDWQPTAAASAMTNLGNNLWGITVNFPDSAVGKKLLYKFVNGNWGADELSDSVVINGCGEGTDKNRFLILPNSNATLTYCWERCAACILSLPVLSTTGSTGLTSTSAISGGTISSSGSAAVSSRGVVWDTQPNPTIALSTKTQNGSGTGNFISNITGLSPNTTYYARAYASSTVGTGYGNQIQFTTLPASTQTVTVTYKVDITNYLAGGATLGTNGIRIGGNFTTRGASLPDWTPSAAACAMTNEGNNIWSISVVYPDTAIGKVQRYKFVNNDWGTNEGSDSLIAGGCGVLDGSDVNRILTIPATNQTYSFCWDRCSACVTAPQNSVTTDAQASGVTQTTATVSGTASGAGITARGVVYAITQNPTLANSVVTSGSGAGAFSANLTGLTAATLYYARAYITVGNTTTYGNEIQFTTLPGSTQTVTVTYKVDITNYLAGGATLGTNGIRIGGNFTTRGASLPDWTPSAAACAMTNEGNNIWSISVVYPDTAIGKVQRYKFVNNDWGTNEGSDSLLAGGCAVLDGSDVNRILTIPATNQTYSFCWDRCSACQPLVANSITTTAATAITQNAATVGGVAVGQNIAARGIAYGTSPNPTILGTLAGTGFGAGTFSGNLSNLTPNTLYYARAYITVGNTTTYGNEIQFTTLPASTQTVTVTYKVDITNYLAGGATLGTNGIRIAGNFTSRGASLPNWAPTAAACAMTNEGNNIWSISVVYPDSAIGKTQFYKFVNNDWGPGTNEGSDSLIAGGCGILDGIAINRILTIPATNQTYSFCWDRCSACVTAPLNSVSTAQAASITQTTATISGTATGTGITARGVVYATTPNPTLSNLVVTSGSGSGDFSANLTGLSAATLYFARTYITVGNTTTYGNEIQFTTLPASTQTVTVTYKVDITNYLAGGATLGTNGIRIGGNFTTRGASLPDWTPSAAACAMTNEGNNIWSISVVYPDSAIGKVQRYKFVNNDWGTNEGSDSLVAGGCGVLDGSDVNRILTIPATNQTYSFCWDRCSACITVSISDPVRRDEMAGIYPNPANQMLFVKGLQGLSNSTFRIFDVRGRQLQTGKVSEPESAISISNLTPGFYSLKIDGMSQSFRFMKEN